MAENAAFVEESFVALTEAWQRGSEVDCTNVHHEMGKMWKHFLEAGFDPKQVVKMMTTMQIINHWEELAKYDTGLQIEEIVKDFPAATIGSLWPRLVEIGAKPDDLIECIGITMWGDDDVAKALKSGVSPEKVLELVKDDFDSEFETPDEFYRILEQLNNAGCPLDSLKAAVKELAWPELIDDFFDDPDSWSTYVNRDDYLDDWLEEYGWDVVSETEGLDMLDRYDIPKDRWLASLTMNNIIDSSRGYSFWEFLEDWARHGGSVDAMATKFVDEIGYQNAGKDTEYFGIAVDLILSGATTIDQKELAKWIQPNVRRAFSTRELEEANADPALIEALKNK